MAGLIAWCSAAWPPSARRYPWRVRQIASFSPWRSWENHIDASDIPAFRRYRRRSLVAYSFMAAYIMACQVQVWKWQARLEHLERGGKPNPQWLE